MNCLDCNGSLNYHDDLDRDLETGKPLLVETWECTNCGSVWTAEDLRKAQYEESLATDAGDSAYTQMAEDEPYEPNNSE